MTTEIFDVSSSQVVCIEFTLPRFRARTLDFYVQLYAVRMDGKQSTKISINTSLVFRIVFYILPLINPTDYYVLTIPHATYHNLQP